MPSKPKNQTACSTCGVSGDIIGTRTEVLERYQDGVGERNDPRRLPMRPARMMVPGRTFLMLPCGHETPA